MILINNNTVYIDNKQKEKNWNTTYIIIENIRVEYPQVSDKIRQLLIKK